MRWKKKCSVLFGLVDGGEDTLVKMVHLGRREQF